MDITKPDIYDPADHPEEWTPEVYDALERARDIIEEWWLPNRRALDRLGGVLAMTEMSEAYYGLYKAMIDGGLCRLRSSNRPSHRRSTTCLPTVSPGLKSFSTIRRMRTPGRST